MVGNPLDIDIFINGQSVVLKDFLQDIFRRASLSAGDNGLSCQIGYFLNISIVSKDL